jgi:hypothetical protein
VTAWVSNVRIECPVCSATKATFLPREIMVLQYVARQA